MMKGGIVMYSLFRFIGTRTAETSKIFETFSSAFSLKTKKNNVAISSKYNVPKDDKKSIQNDYKKIGKDFYKALRNYEQKGTKQFG